MPLVLLHLAGQPAIAEVVGRGEQDRLDLRVPMIYEGGPAELLEIFGARRGIEDGQWEELPGEVLPEPKEAPAELELPPAEPPAPAIAPPRVPVAIAVE